MHKVDQHYKMKIPFQSTNVVQPDNKIQALGRLRMLGKKLIKDEHLKICTPQASMICRGWATQRRLTNETQGVNGKSWYMPHHGVCHSSKPGKVRIVFDCLAKYKEACLKSSVFPGPDLTNKLVGILQRFRQEEVAITADIEAMYHQIGVMQADRDVYASYGGEMMMSLKMQNVIG